MEEVNFNVVQGDTFNIRVSYKNPDDSVIDLSDYIAKMEVRDKPGGRILCASATTENGGIAIDGPNGTLDIEFIPDQTKKFTNPTAAYQIKIINSDNGQQTTLTKGYFKVSQAVIR